MAGNSKTGIRMAKVSDSKAILDIYAPYIEQTAITFTSSIPKVRQVAKTMNDIQSHYPYLVCEIDGKIAGFAYAYKIRPHEAYRWNAELSVYIKPSYQGRGIATALYTALLQLLKAQGYCNLYALITIPNDASIALHRHFGFSESMVQRACGYKLGAWHDVLWMEYRIPDASDPGSNGLPVSPDKLNSIEVKTILALASALLNGTNG